MSFESVPCGSPESHTVIEEPAPSLYSGEETDDRFMKTLKRPQEVPESTRLADTAKIEDEIIMNEEQIARVTGRINPAPPLEPPVLTRVTPRRNFCEERDESDPRDDSARRTAMRAGYFGRQWIDLNGVNPQVAGQNHSSEYIENHHLEHGSIKGNRSKSLHEKAERERDSRVSGGVSVIKSAREQEVESDSDTDNSTRDSRKIGLHDKEESMNLTCNENISVEQLRDEREEDMRRSYFYNYGMSHEDINNPRVSRVPEYESDGGKEKSISNGQAGESGDIRMANKLEHDGTGAPVSVYYMQYPAHMAPISRARQAGLVSQGNASLQQTHIGGHTREQLAHLAVSDGRGGYRIQQVEYRPEQQVPIANSSEENAERNMMIAGVGHNAGVQYVDRQGLIPSGFAVVPGIGPVRVMDGMFYHQTAIPMGAEPNHYENFAPVSSFMPMGNLQGKTASNPTSSATSTPTNESGAAQTQEKALNVDKPFTSPPQHHTALSSPNLDDKRSTSSPAVTSDRDSPAPNGDDAGDCKKFPSTRQRNKQRPLGGAKSEIKCDQCGKLFGSSSALAKHKLTHSDERRYVCQICSKGFKRQDHLNGHMVTHRDKKPYECSFADCDKSYCDMRSLRRHLENHHAALAATSGSASTSVCAGNKQANTVTAVTVVPAVGHAEMASGHNMLKVRTRTVRGDRNKDADESSGNGVLNLQVGGYDSGKSSGRSTPSGTHDVVPLRDRMINQIVRERNSDSLSSVTSEEAGVHTGETSSDHTPETASHTESSKQLTAVNMLKQAAERAQEDREKQAGGERFQQNPYMAYQEGVPYQQWYPAGMYGQDPRIVYQYAQGIMFPTQAYHVSSVTGMVPDVQNRQAVTQRFGGDPHEIAKPSLRNLNQIASSPREHGSGDAIQQPYFGHPKTRNAAGTPTNPTAIAIATAKDIGKYRYTHESYYGVHPSGTQWQQVRYDDNTAIPFSSEHKQGLMGNNKSIYPHGHSIESSVEADNDSTRHYGKHPSYRAEHSEDSYGSASKRHHTEQVFPSSRMDGREYERFMALQDAQHKARAEDNNNYDNQANGPSKTSDDSPGFFRNPREIMSPRRKQRPKPEPLQIPDHVSTNFPGSPKNRSRPCTPPIYTPPPMLSPHSIFSHIARPLTPRSSGIPQLPMTPSRLLLSSRSCRSSIEADDESYQFPEPKINIGSQFQAEIPEFLGFRSKASMDAHPATIVWSPLDERKRGRRDEIESYLDVACSVAVVGGGSNKEYALHVLHKAKGNIKEAVRDLLKKKSAMPATDPMYCYRYEGSVKWAAKERQTFRNSFRIKGKEFADLKKEVGSKSVNDCVEFYYLWKATHPEAVRGRTRYIDSDSDEDYEDTSSETNSNPSLFECDFPQCSAKFVSRQALNGHIRVHGGSFMKPEPRKRSRTPANSSTTTSGDSVPPIKKRRPAAPVPPPVNPLDPDAPLPEYACKVCGRIFHKIKSRSAHMKTHVKRPDTHDDGKNSAVIVKSH